MRTITIEEHFATEGYMDGPGRQLREQAKAGSNHPRAQGGFAEIVNRLCDLDTGRIKEMDAARIDMQVLSLNSPGLEQVGASEVVALARDVNDALARAVQRHPDRFAGFATLPTAVPDAAARELERTVHEYNFKGAAINGHIGGRYLDDPVFSPFLGQAEALSVPIYLHPAPPPKPVIETSYTGNFKPEVTVMLAGAAWGWHIETAIHILRMVLGGVFDRFPNLQMIVGHMGESLPFMLPRLEETLPPQATGLKRSIGAYLRENVSYSFSGFNFTPNFLNLLMVIGVDRILFSADYPYSSMVQARSFLEQLPVSPADRERIAHGNAERLLHF